MCVCIYLIHLKNLGIPILLYYIKDKNVTKQRNENGLFKKDYDAVTLNVSPPEKKN